jgi:hypothetical protein
MRSLLFLSLLLGFVVPNQNPASDSSSLIVLEKKWTRSTQRLEKVEPPPPGPAREIIAANRNYPRNARINDPVGARDPNLDTIDGRSAALEKAVQDSRRSEGKPVLGYSYRAKVQNTSKSVVDIVFWEYQFVDAADPAIVTRRQFLCGVNIKPDKTKELQAFTLAAPSEVVSVGTLASKDGSPLKESVIINRVEYADGTIWQRKSWNFAEIRLGYTRAVATPWGPEMCRSL